MDRNRKYRINEKQKHFRKRKEIVNKVKDWNMNDEQVKKEIVNKVKDWNMNDEQVKVTFEEPISITSNSFYEISTKKIEARRQRKNNKVDLREIEY